MKHNTWDKTRTCLDFPVGCRVEFHPCTDEWAMGAKFGTVTRSTAEHVTVQPDDLRQRRRVTDMELIRRIT